MWDRASDYFDDTMRSLGLLTRLRLDDRWFEGFDGRYDRAARALPVAGAVATLPAALALAALALVGVAAPIAATVAVAVQLIVTAALHEDGLADSFDGLGVQGRERKLAVMRDSATGVFGVCALVTALLLRVLCLAALAASPLVMLAAWVFASGGARGAMVYLWHRSPPASATGAAHSAGHPNRAATRQALIAVALLGMPALVLSGPVAVATAVLLVVGAVRVVKRTLVAPVGGHTGDLLGAMAVIAELCVRIALASIA